MENINTITEKRSFINIVLPATKQNEQQESLLKSEMGLPRDIKEQPKKLE